MEYVKTPAYTNGAQLITWCWDVREILERKMCFKIHQREEENEILFLLVNIFKSEKKYSSKSTYWEKINCKSNSRAKDFKNIF